MRLFSTVDQVPGEDWDRLARAQPEPLFFERRFLRGLEQGRGPGLENHYALLYDGSRPVGLGIFQLADFVGQPVAPLLERAPTSVGLMVRRLPLLQRDLRVRVLVCGNAFTSGAHGFAFLPDVHPGRALRGLLDAAARIQQAAAGGRPSVLLFKDFSPNTPDAAALRVARRLRDHAFSALETEPNMVLEVDPTWDGYEGYLASLASKYRVKAKRAFAKSADLTLRELHTADLDTHAHRLGPLYDAVLERADYRLGRQTPAAFSALREALGDELVLRGAFLGDELVGFSTGFVSGSTLETQCVGLDYGRNRELAIYPRLLYDYLQVALDRRLSRVNYGRTATEIKSTLGAEPEAVRCYVRHEQRTVNRLLPLLSRHLRLPSAALRRPFKQAFYVARAEAGRHHNPAADLDLALAT